MRTIDGVVARSDETVAEALSREGLTQRAAEILTFIEQLRQEWGLQEALRAAEEYYVDNEAHGSLQRLGRVLVRARRQALIQQQLDEDREQLHRGRLPHNELVSTGHHYEMLRREACEYNHELRTLIEVDGHHFSRYELTDWLVRASQGRHSWVQGEITGAGRQSAFAGAMAGVAG